MFPRPLSLRCWLTKKEKNKKESLGHGDVHAVTLFISLALFFILVDYIKGTTRGTKWRASLPHPCLTEQFSPKSSSIKEGVGPSLRTIGAGAHSLS